jgi:hypothetical protein
MMIYLYLRKIRPGAMIVTVALPRRTTATLCVAEINHFSNHSVHAPGENELASLITALETLLSSHKVGMSGETGIQSATPPEEMGILEQMENAPDAVSGHGLGTPCTSLLIVV